MGLRGGLVRSVVRFDFICASAFIAAAPPGAGRPRASRNPQQGVIVAPEEIRKLTHSGVSAIL